jgi:hypothetical protein
MGISPALALARSNLKTTGTPSSRSEFDSENGAERCAGSWYQQAGQLPQLASFFCHIPLERGQDIRTIQELIDHKDLKTTMIYTHVRNRGPLGVASPADFL